MSEQSVLWLFGTLIGALFGLIGVLGRIFWAKLSALDTGALAQFVARDTEREKQWMFWRDDVNKRLDAHGSHLKELEGHHSALSTRITKLERNGH